MKNFRERRARARGAWLAATAASIAMPTMVQAQAALEEVTVTARKVEESLLDVPISISAVSATELKQYDIRDLGDLQKITPGFQITETGFRRSRENFNLVMRGLNVFNFSGVQSAATIFIDGAPYVGGRPSSYQDVERIEVLKGPQSAYFGRSTFTGAINFITKDPSKEWRGEISGGVGQFNSSDALLSVEGPLGSDELTFRATIRNLVLGPQYSENMLNAPVGERKTQSGSATIHWTPTDALSVKIFGEYAEFHDSFSMVWDYPMNEFANCNPGGGATRTWICGNPPPLDIAISRLGFPAVVDTRFDQTIAPLSIYGKRLLGPGDNLVSDNIATHAIADYTFGNGLTLSGIAAYHSAKTQSLEESTEDSKFGWYPCPLPAGCGRPFGQYIFLIDYNRHDRYLEARLSSDQESRLRWTVGGTYANAEYETWSGGEIPTVPPQTFGFNSINESETQGLFGGIYFDFTDKLTGGVELRYQSDEITNTPNKRAVPVQSISDTFTATTPRISLDYKFRPEYMVYASYSEGTRPGGFNGALLSRPQFVIDILQNQFGVKLVIEEEELQQYEIGLKGRFLDGRLQSTLALYKSKVLNQQIAQSIFVNVPGVLVNTIGFTNNAGETELQGVEIEGAAVITDRLRVDFGYGYYDSEIIADTCAQCVRVGASLTASLGNKVDGTPTSSGSLAATYTVPMQSGTDWYARGEYFYTGVMYGDRMNLSETEASHRVNLRAGLNADKFNFEAYLLNAFDDDTPVNIGLNTDLPSFGVSLKIGLPDRQQWGVRGTYRF